MNARKLKIVAVTDIHGAYKLVAQIFEHERPDAGIIGGDLTNVGSVKEAEAALKLFQSKVPTLFCVAGNMDLPQHDELYRRLGISINASGLLWEGIGLFGISAAPISPLKTPYELTEEELLRRGKEGFRQIRHAKRKIFVPHAPPFGTRVDIIHSGFHVGSMSVRELVEDYRPDLVICGHIHEAYGDDLIGPTKVVNCGPARNGHYVVVTIDEEITVQHKKS